MFETLPGESLGAQFAPPLVMRQLDGAHDRRWQAAEDPSNIRRTLAWVQPFLAQRSSGFLDRCPRLPPIIGNMHEVEPRRRAPVQLLKTRSCPMKMQGVDHQSRILSKR